MTNVVFFHGEKGGVGKSTALMWVADYVLMDGGMDKLGIIEADNVRDIKQRFDRTGQVVESPLEIEDDDSRLGGMLRVFETAAEMAENGIETIFVNLPGRASVRLDPNAELLKESMEEAGLKMSVVFVADADDHSRTLFDESMRAGLLSVADETVLVFNARHGRDTENWPVAETTEHPDHLATMPEIDASVWGSVKQAAAPLSTIATDKALSVLKRNVLKRWIRSAEPVATAVTASKAKGKAKEASKQ